MFTKYASRAIKQKVKPQLSIGDQFELVKIDVAPADDMVCVKMYLTLQNKRTGDKHELATDDVLFEAAGEDAHNINNLMEALWGPNPLGHYGRMERARKRAIKILKKAGLISPNYTEAP
jgi:hypothetical protein